MKKSNIILSIVLAAVLVVCLSSCLIPAFAPFLGTYSRKYTSVSYGTKTSLKESWTFKGDGTGSYKVSSDIYSTGWSFDYTYTVSDITLSIGSLKGDPIKYTMSNWNKTMVFNGDTFTKE